MGDVPLSAAQVFWVFYRSILSYPCRHFAAWQEPDLFTTEVGTAFGARSDLSKAFRRPCMSGSGRARAANCPPWSFASCAGSCATSDLAAARLRMAILTDRYRNTRRRRRYRRMRNARDLQVSTSS
jgi:hypothetical protein